MTSEKSPDPLAPITNALATADQVLVSHTRGLSADLVARLHYTGGSLAQVSGAILKLETQVIATALVLFHRFHLLAGFLEHSIDDTVKGCLYIATMLCEVPVNPRDIVAAVEAACDDPLATGFKSIIRRKPASFGPQFLNALYKAQLQVLTTLGFDMHVVVPYTLCLEYLQAMNISEASDRALLGQRAWNYLNDMMKSRICIFQQPNAMAVTALWLASRETEVDLLDGERWWTIFDVDTEDMGHILVLLRESKAIAISERDRLVKGLEPTLRVEDVTARINEEATA
ncbi:cyclin-like protein [Myxozyma melibiosi]|uniref:Cyclin-like protein n=1 Tax=Myxozyma melibiosi TaxID=54550 RepID=A0ABR1FAN7_9ASCO